LTSGEKCRSTLPPEIERPSGVARTIQKKTKKNAIVEYLDTQIPLTQLKGPKGNGDMQAAPTGGTQI